MKYKGGNLCLLPEILAWKLLTSLGGCCFWLLPECILATRSCTFKPELPLSCTAAIVTILWSFVQIFSKHSFPELNNFVRHFSADSRLKYSCAKTDAVQHCAWDQVWYYITEGQKCIYQQQMGWFKVQFCYNRQLILNSHLKKCDSVYMAVQIGSVFGLYILLISRIATFHLWGRVYDKVYNTNTNTLEELRYNILSDISSFSRQELQTVNSLPQLHSVHSVRRVTFSTSVVALASFCWTF